MSTPFPNDTDFSDYNTARGLPPFEIDIVYNYGGYRLDTKDIHSRENGEFQYSIRSVYKYMPWFRTIYIVCPDELAHNLSHSKLWPVWLNQHKMTKFVTASNGKTHSIEFVPQSSLMHADKRNAIGNKNSNAFEINIHRIPGLSQHFISLCDDFFIGRPLTWKYFFIRTRNSSYYTPRFPLSVFLAYFTSKPTYHVYDLYDTTYDCDITEYEPQWRAYKDNITTVIPSRIEQYFSHQPRPLTKHVMNTFYMKFPKWFAFVESHKRRYCCPNPRKGFMCDRQENMWLTLYKQYVDFEIEVDIMTDPTEMPNMGWFFKVRPKDLMNFYNTNLPMKDKTEKLKEIRPYTFSINDHYSSNLQEYLDEVTMFHHFANDYWLKPAVFEVQFENPSIIAWKELAANLKAKIKA